MPHTVLEWPLSRIQEELPDVSVTFGRGKQAWTAVGKLTGRRNRCATVTIYKTGVYRSGTDPLMRIEYSWETIVNALNTRRALKG